MLAFGVTSGTTFVAGWSHGSEERINNAEKSNPAKLIGGQTWGTWRCACKPWPTIQPCIYGRALMELFLQMCREHDCSIQEEGKVSAYETIHIVTQTMVKGRCVDVPISQIPRYVLDDALRSNS